MRTVTCDLCGGVIQETAIQVTVNDGEHPHNGSTMRKSIDCCGDCIQEVPDLRTDAEFDDLRAKLK